MANQLREDQALLRANEALLSAKNYALFAVTDTGAIDAVVDFSGMSHRDFCVLAKAVTAHMMDVMSGSVI